MQNVTFKELNEKKFNVVERIGIIKDKGVFKFFILETVPPTTYGEDCKSYTWYAVCLKDIHDLEGLKDFLKNIFEIGTEFKSNEEAKRVVKALNKALISRAKVIDWGACHVTELPISELFRKER